MRTAAESAEIKQKVAEGKIDIIIGTQLVAKGEGVVAEVFGNEGTGGHSHLVYPWKTGSRQRFFVTARPEGDATIYSGYWFHPDKQAWMLIASFRAAKDGQGLRRLYAFSENFGGSTGHLRRKALFGFVPGFTPSGAAFTRPATGTPPAIRLP